MTSTAIIYHEVKPGIPCADGIAAAWVAQKLHPEAKLIGCSYGNVPDEASFDRLIIVDFSFPLNILNGWLDEGIEVLVIDHHKTAMDDLKSFSFAIFDMNESGATLAWKTFFPDQPMPAFLEYVKDRDLWDFALEKTEEIYEAMSFLGRKFQQFDWLASLSKAELIAALAPLGEQLLKPKRERIQEIAGCCRIRNHNQKIAIVQIPPQDSRLTSDVCSFIYKSDPSIDYVVSYSWDEKDNLWSISLRSDKNGSNFDVSEIAKQYGGGGHRNAAGCRVRDHSGLIEML